MIFKHIALLSILFYYHSLYAFNSKNEILNDPLECFLMDVDYDSLEIRYIEENIGNKSTNIRWFISFGNLKKSISNFLKNNQSIVGKFKHGNYGGWSYFFTMSPSVHNKLEEIRSKQIGFGIWDYIYCEKAILKLKPLENNSYEIYMDEIESPLFQWDD